MAQSPNIGEMAPNFELPSWKDDLIKLSAFRGMHVILYFVATIEDEQSTDIIKKLAEIGREFPTLDLVTLVVTTDDTSTLQEFVTQHFLDIIFLSDVLTSVHQQYGALRVKRGKNGQVQNDFKELAFVINPNGKILNIFERNEQDSTALAAAITEWMKNALLS